MGQGHVESNALRKTFVKTAGILFIYLIASGHVGSPDTWFEGNAGPYHVTVQVTTAGVVPGVAKIYVRAIGDRPDRVTVQANKFDATGGAPPPEPATPVQGDDGLFAGKLWIMSGGSNSVTVSASGPKGSGKVVVPVVVVAYSRLKLDKPMGFGLALMGVFLFAGLVTIVGAAVRESVIPPGEFPTPATRNRARFAMGLTSILLIAAIAGGWRWWNSEDASYVRGIFKPMTASASVDPASSDKLTFAITEPAWTHRADTAWLSKNGRNSWTPLVEDHGKLIHLFLIKEGSGVFAHLHPTTADSVTFSSVLPPITAGKYRVFADIVHESGYTQTLVTAVNVPGVLAPSSSQAADADDSWFIGRVSQNVRVFRLLDGATIEWLNDGIPFVAGRPAPMRFVVRNADGSDATLEPYMGMAGHAVVEEEDGSVFVHLHPMGTISMASQMAFAMRRPGDTIRGQLGKRVSEAEMSQMKQATISSNIVSFPYAFPKPGDYRIWVQVRHNGQVQTGAFAMKVLPDVRELMGTSHGFAPSDVVARQVH